MIRSYSGAAFRALGRVKSSAFTFPQRAASLGSISKSSCLFGAGHGLCRAYHTSPLSDSATNEPIFTPASEFALPISDDEAELFQMFSSVVKELKEEKNIDCTVRVAGGWVRDKLLMTNMGASPGAVSTHASHAMDIDIALDAMSGVQFAQALNEWSIRKEGGKLTQPTDLTNTNSNNTGTDRDTDTPGYIKIGVISQNPDKSKHLETATVQLGDFSIDFVNLRSET